ncbi:helix-turn-helix domain-containing protein [Actinomyces gaoshouyii]|uniref:helix-turn-helix domain-containing protein n=1 Tax=Actinomyces gaoshouyii TaxID=1960083 RepID=UPI001E2BBA75|nr:hypothetical protein [Actinomyces gaoshouyii]
MHENTVRAIWRQRPRPTPARRGAHRFTQEHRQRAEVLVAQGVSLIDIGLELGFDRGTVRRHLAAENVTKITKYVTRRQFVTTG